MTNTNRILEKEYFEGKLKYIYEFFTKLMVYTIEQKATDLFGTSDYKRVEPNDGEITLQLADDDCFVDTHDDTIYYGLNNIPYLDYPDCEDRFCPECLRIDKYNESLRTRITPIEYIYRDGDGHNLVYHGGITDAKVHINDLAPKEKSLYKALEFYSRFDYMKYKYKTNNRAILNIIKDNEYLHDYYDDLLKCIEDLER